jgi:hypothetical protein
VLGLGSAGCGNPLGIGPDTCDRSLKNNPPIVYSDGTIVNGAYQTSDWGGEWLYFPGGMHYRLEHKLGASPTWVVPYLSFADHGIGSGVDADGGEADGGIAAVGAGDPFGVIGSDDTYLTVVNATCVTYFLRVVAGTATPGAVPTDAGAD